MNGTLRKLALPGALVMAIGAGATALEIARDPLPDLQAQGAVERAQQPGGAESLSSAFRSASREALPSVVYVEVEAAPRAVSQRADQFRGTPFEGLFGPQAAPAPQRGSGSGFIISADGYILTNNHVVDGANRVMVTFSDRREMEARVIGRDPNTDIAVLKVEAEGLPVAEMGNSDALETGDWVLALGYPLSLGQTTTAGIVSAKGRSIGIMRQNEGATAPLEHFIQTDAAINPGNSGGPLVDLRGRVVGVNSAIASPTGFYSGYGFAVPISLARRVSDDLIRYGVVHRPMLGVNVRTATPADAEVFRLPRPAGAVIAAETTGPAKEAGIRMGDVVIAVDGQEVVDDGALTEHLARRRPGDRVVLDLIRYGVPERVTVRLSEMEVAPVERTAERNATRDPVARLGFEAMQVTPPVARQYRLPFISGVMVTGVDRIGPAASALTPGMRVERLNGREIRSLDNVRAAARELSPGEVVSLVVRMQDDRQTIVNYRLR